MQQTVPECKCRNRGVIKPDITFFGEQVTSRVDNAVKSDKKHADLVLVLGTSLKVAPVSHIIQHMPRCARRLSCTNELQSQFMCFCLNTQSYAALNEITVAINESC